MKYLLLLLISSTAFAIPSAQEARQIIQKNRDKEFINSIDYNIKLAIANNLCSTYVPTGFVSELIINKEVKNLTNLGYKLTGNQLELDIDWCE